MDIAASSGHYERLQLTGDIDIEKCVEKWEEIVSANSEANNSFEYANYVEKYRSYSLLLNEYITVKAMLTKLAFAIDKDLIEWLSKKGYKIVTNEGNDRYEESLMNAIRRSDNLVTKTMMKANELRALQNKQNNKIGGFESVIADLIFSLGFEVKDDITLARYNELKKLIKRKHEAAVNARKR